MKKPRPSRLRERVWTVSFMLVLTLFFGSGVSALHVLTLERVMQNELLFLRRAVRAAVGLPVLEDEPLRAWFEASVDTDAAPVFRVRDEDFEGAERLVVERSQAGLWGGIRAVVGLALDDEGPFVTGVAFLDHNETPGLGARIEEAWFREQLRGKRGTLRLVPEGTRLEGRPSDNEIDAITGATVTSTAVRDLLNRALSEDAVRLTGERSADDGHDARR